MKQPVRKREWESKPFISTQRFVVYEIAKPGKKVLFKFKAKAPEGTKRFEMELVNAVVVK